MRVFYVIYAALMILLLWGSYGDTVAKDLALKAVLALWCVALLTMLLNVRNSEWVALSAFVPLMGVLLFQVVGRVIFIVEHGGMDCPKCNGSPMAFLMGWIMEAILLVTGTLLCIWLVRRLKSSVLKSEI